MSTCAIAGIFPLIFPLAFFIIFFTVLYFSNKKKRDALKKLSNFLRGAIPRYSFLPTFSGEYQGLKFSIILIPAGKNSPAFLKIEFIKNSFFKLRIYKESTLSQLGKKIGVVHEVKINDEAFDKEFLIFSNKPNQVTVYLNNSNVKNAIRELFRNGFEPIIIDGKKITTQKPNYKLDIDLAAQNIGGVLQDLSLLATGL